MLNCVLVFEKKDIELVLEFLKTELIIDLSRKTQILNKFTITEDSYQNVDFRFIFNQTISKHGTELDYYATELQSLTNNIDNFNKQCKTNIIDYTFFNVDTAEEKLYNEFINNFVKSNIKHHYNYIIDNELQISLNIHVSTSILGDINLIEWVKSQNQTAE